MSCLQLCINTNNCSGTMLREDNCFLIPTDGVTYVMSSSFDYDTYIPICSRPGKDNTGQLTTIVTAAPTSQMIVITTDVVSSDGMTTVASSTVSAPESTSDGTLPRSTPETPLTTEPPSQTIGTTTEWVSTIETSTATSTISTQEGGSSRTNEVLTTPTQTGSDKQDTSQIASGADVITEGINSYDNDNKFVMCRQPVLPPHTVVRGNGRYYVWSVVILACSSIRYTFPEGGAQRTLICLPNGQWHVNITNGCVDFNYCENIKSEDNQMDIRYPIDTIRDTVCPTHYRMPSGLWARKTVCLKSGEWLGIHGTCKEERCPPLPWFENATVHILSYDNITNYYSQHTVTCREGFRFLDGTKDTVIECTPGGYWTPTDDCLIEVCPSLTQPTYGVLSTSISVYGTLVTMTCLRGHKLHNNDRSIKTLCRGIDGWTVNISDCTPVVCSPPSFVTDAIRDNNKSSYLTNVTYHCNSNLKFEDGHQNKTITCLDSGYWSDTNFTCGADRCPPVPVLNTTIPESTRAVEGTLVRYSCVTGYTLPGDDKYQTITCQQGVWQDVKSLTECLQINCTLMNPSDGHYVMTTNNSELTVGSHIHVTCNEGYLFVGGEISDDFECLLTGQWSDNYTCEPVDCGTSPIVRHAQMTVEGDNKYKDRAIYHCLDGYWFSYKVYSYTVTCQANGSWSNVPNYCTEIRCPPLTLFHGLFTSSRDVWVHTDVNISCYNSSVNDTDVMTVTCMTNGDWDPTPLTCPVDNQTRFKIEPEEARHSQTLGSVILITMGTISIIIVLSDAKLLYRQMFGKVIKR